MNRLFGNRLFGLVSLSIMALVSFGASAEIINLHQKVQVYQKVQVPAIIRGAPLRCDNTSPLIIHVNDAPQRRETCEPIAYDMRHHKREFGPRNIFIIFGNSQTNIAINNQAGRE